MKLNLNAKELLSLHNLLQARFDSGSYAEDSFKEGDPAASHNMQLRQVHNRLRALILGALSAQPDDSFQAWFSSQQKKVEKLNDERPVVDTISEQPVLQDDYEVPDYPRKGSGGGQRGNRGKGRGKQ